MNGLGGVIKFLTGNLDAADGERFDHFIQNIKDKEQDLRFQLQNQYSLTNSIMNSFNKTLQDIQFNNVQLKNKIIEISQNVSALQKEINIRDILLHLQTLYDILLNIFTNIENSILFCKQETLHPSIVTLNTLFKEISRISPFYKNRIPISQHSSLIDLEKTISVNCKINNREIVYFISLPITDGSEYDLIELYPIPFKSKDKYLSIIPSVNHAIINKESKIVKFLNKGCMRGTMTICEQEYINNQKFDCELSIIRKQPPTNCSYVNLQISKGFVEQIPHTPYIIAILPQEDKITISSSQGSETHSLQGIYALSSEKTISFHGEVINPVGTTHGKPAFVAGLRIDIDDDIDYKLQIDLRKLTLKDINSNPQLVYNPPLLMSQDSLILHVIPSFVMFIIIFGIICIYQKVKNYEFFNRNNNVQNTPNSGILEYTN